MPPHWLTQMVMGVPNLEEGEDAGLAECGRLSKAQSGPVGPLCRPELAACRRETPGQTI